MHIVKIDRPSTWETVNLYALADLHVGDPGCIESVVASQIERIKNDPYAVCVLNGDICNTALKTSVSDVYGEKLTPMQQMQRAVDLLRPIREKIIAATTGNHENRISRNDGIDITRLVCRELCIEDYYDPNGVVCFIRFGRKPAHQSHADRDGKQFYSVYLTHGSGGGRKEGAKAIRLADMASIVDVDVYIHSHTHLPMVFKESFFRLNTGSASVAKVDHLFVNTGACLDYGGYGQAQEFKPSTADTPVIHLYAARKYASATL